MDTKDFLQKVCVDLFGFLDVSAIVEVSCDEKDQLYIVEVTGEDVGNLIGYKGNVINALQSFLFVACKKEYLDNINVQFDVNGYRKKRTESLKNMVKEASDKVAASGSYRFGALNPYERRIVHTVISENYPNLVSYSIGEGMDRRLVVSKADI